jgi:hypothetical protein
MSFYTCFVWFKKLRLFVNEQNLKIDVVLKASCAVVIRWFSLNEAPLGLFKFISDYLPYFEKINIFFNIITKKFELIYKDWSKLFVWFIRNNLNQVISSWTEQTFLEIIISRKIITAWKTTSVHTMSTGPPAEDQNFVRTSKFFSFYLDIFMDWSQFLFGSWRNNLIEIISNEPNK